MSHSIFIHVIIEIGTKSNRNQHHTSPSSIPPSTHTHTPIHPQKVFNAGAVIAGVSSGLVAGVLGITTSMSVLALKARYHDWRRRRPSIEPVCTPG